MTEIWKSVIGWEGLYEVSNHGQVRTVERVIVRSNGASQRVKGAIRKISIGKHGYPQVSLKRSGGSTTHYVHRLVMSAFAGKCPDGMEVLHIDGNRANSELSNLRYGTRSENNLDAVRHGTHPWASKTHCPSGHEYDTANTYVSRRSDGRRFRTCKKCHADLKARRRIGAVA